jgi:hypothetical protein
MMEGSFWEGQGWHVLGLGKLTEVRISDETGTATYLLLFLRENMEDDYTKQVATFLDELLGASEAGEPLKESMEQRSGWERLDLKTVQSILEQFFQKLGYRTILDQSDLQTLGLAKGILPDFYQRAVASDVAKIIMY